jgi:hypothetical protein
MAPISGNSGGAAQPCMTMHAPPIPPPAHMGSASTAAAAAAEGGVVGAIPFGLHTPMREAT